MSNAVTIHVLVENTATRGMLGEHGISYWVVTANHRLLFDTGQGRTLAANAREMGADLAAADCIALSHGHYDHTGGLSVALESARRPRVYAHPAALEPKFAKSGDAPGRAIGLRAADQAALAEHAGELILTNQPREIGDGIMLTGEIPRVTDFEDTGGPFFLDQAGTRADPLLDDQAVLLDLDEGVVVLLGCAHAGVVNTLRHVKHLMPGKSIHAVIGGMHLVTAGAARLDATMEAFREFDVRQLGPAHCTGIKAMARFWSEFPGRCVACNAGSRLDFGA